jgi:hypothetical protein
VAGGVGGGVWDRIEDEIEVQGDISPPSSHFISISLLLSVISLDFETMEETSEPIKRGIWLRTSRLIGSLVSSIVSKSREMTESKSEIEMKSSRDHRRIW